MSLEYQSIGSVAEVLGVSAHTLRYYEKIGLLAPVFKDSSGRRKYSRADIECLGFIKRAQRMHFSLKEIRALIDLDRAQTVEKDRAQALVIEKLNEIEESLKDLRRLKKDLAKMLEACVSSKGDEDCPIIEGIRTPRK